MEISTEKPIVISYTPTSGDVGKFEKNILTLLDNAAKPEFVFVNLSTRDFPRRMEDVPLELKKLLMTNPKVKVVWDGNNPLASDSEYMIIDADEDMASAIKCHIEGNSAKSDEIV